jgi:hypothetical protein
MSTIQNLKNFIRHGKQARQAHADPTTVPPVHALDHHGLPVVKPAGVDYSAAAVGNGNMAAQAGGLAAQRADYDPSAIERIVAEERASKGKLPTYPGLERFQLLEKMGDGAFSNVYRAKDSIGEFDEVAIKVVRKFELNNQQVRTFGPPTDASPFTSVSSQCQPCFVLRETTTFIQISKSSQRLSRCASLGAVLLAPFPPFLPRSAPAVSSMLTAGCV